VPPGALLRIVRSIARSELDFKLVELVPLSVGTLPLRYREQLLQALAGGNRLGPVHGGIIPSLRGYGRRAAQAPPCATSREMEMPRWRVPVSPTTARALRRFRLSPETSGCSRYPELRRNRLPDGRSSRAAGRRRCVRTRFPATGDRLCEGSDRAGRSTRLRRCGTPRCRRPGGGSLVRRARVCPPGDRP